MSTGAAAQCCRRVAAGRARGNARATTSPTTGGCGVVARGPTATAATPPAGPHRRRGGHHHHHHHPRQPPSRCRLHRARSSPNGRREVAATAAVPMPPPRLASPQRGSWFIAPSPLVEPRGMGSPWSAASATACFATTTTTTAPGDDVVGSDERRRSTSKRERRHRAPRANGSREGGDGMGRGGSDGCVTGDGGAHAAPGRQRDQSQSQAQREHRRRRPPPPMAIGDASDASDRMADILVRRGGLVDDAGAAASDGGYSRRREEGEVLVREAMDLVEAVRRGLARGTIAKRGSDLRAVSNIYDSALVLYNDYAASFLSPLDECDEAAEREECRDVAPSGCVGEETEQPPPPDGDGLGLFDAALGILRDMDRIGLDMTSNHFAIAVRIACSERRWADAAGLFVSQLDDHDAGMTPMDVTAAAASSSGRRRGVDGPVGLGLYSIARAVRGRQRRRSRTGERGGGEEWSREDEEETSDLITANVFEAVTKLSMVSPSDSDAFVFEAIAALGRAGEAKACLRYLQSPEGTRMGQPLVAAVMEACIECHQWEEAIDLFFTMKMENDDLVGSEWQVGGNFNNILPACRDAALRALKLAPGGQSRAAVEMVDDAIDSKAPLGVDGIESAMSACEKDADWRGACHILERVLDDTVGLFEDGADATDDTAVPIVSSGIVSSMMRTCNGSKEYGTALIYGQLVGLAHREGYARTSAFAQTKPKQPSHIDTISFDAPTYDPVEGLLSQPLLKESESVFLATMNSLCGVGGHIHALRLYDQLIMDVGSETLKSWTDVQEQYRKLQHHRDCESENESWDSAQKNIIILLTMNDVVSASDAAKMMRLCTAASQPNAGLCLARRVARRYSASTARNYFLELPSAREARESRYSEPQYMISTDDIAAATMEALRHTGESEAAVDLFLKKLKEESDSSGSYLTFHSHENVSQWVLSPHECITTLVGLGDFDGAHAVLDGMDVNARTPLSYVLLARGLASNEMWAPLVATWRQADEAKCLSEELCLLALQAVANGRHDNDSISLFISIAISLERFLGVKRGEWIERNFDFVKNNVSDSGILDLLWKGGRFKSWQLAFNRQLFHELRSSGEAVDASVLISIVDLAGHWQREHDCRGYPVPDLPSQAPERDRRRQRDDRKHGIDVIAEALGGASLTGLSDHPEFTKHAAMGLRALKGNHEVVTLILDLSARGATILPDTFLQALYAADALEDRESKEEVIRLMTNAGYDYKT